MLALQRVKDATQPHDYIYSLLGLCNLGVYSNIPSYLTPDYKKPFEQVCYDVVTNIIIETGDLRLLNNTNSHLSGVPSWVPDFRHSSPFWRKGIMDKHSVTLSANRKYLKVKGTQLGTCEVILPEVQIKNSYRTKYCLKSRIDEIEYMFSHASTVYGAN